MFTIVCMNFDCIDASMYNLHLRVEVVAEDSLVLSPVSSELYCKRKNTITCTNC